MNLGGRRIPWPRGRLLGGSSAINGMVFTRGHRSSYDDWQVEGWGFDDLLPYFRRSERTTGRDSWLRGAEGPLRVGPAGDPHPLASDFLAAAAEIGQPAATDLSGGLETGFGLIDLTIAEGRRVDSATAYLTPAAGRPNLRLVCGARVHPWGSSIKAPGPAGGSAMVHTSSFRPRWRRISPPTPVWRSS